MKTIPDLAPQLALKGRLPRTWPAFFAHHGSFSPAQLAAIPPLLHGANVVLAAPTASGKTAAAVAPLIERHCPPTRPRGRLSLLYLVPTRALANDLAERLRHPVESLGLALGVKTGDNAFRPTRPPDLLITTPESLDSLLASHPRLLIHLRALVIDELHLFDTTPRGDQLRVLLNRIRRIRSYAASRGDAADATVQYAALSATLGDAAATAARYFAPAEVVAVPGGRTLAAETIALEGDGTAALGAFLASFRARGWRKGLVFCNSRAEVETYAAAARADSPFGDAVYVHYSNIEPERRREIERRFADDAAAICFSSSTLELGIDIGDIDCVILIGPPGSTSAFAQRIGRGSRRRGTTPVVCCYRTSLERLLFDALITYTSSQPPIPNPQSPIPNPFRPSVAIQQIFSMIKQSPTAALRLAELADLFAGMLSAGDIEAILGELHRRGYLTTARGGEWRAGPKLNKLFDEQTRAQVSLSIYGNIQSDAAQLIPIRDQHTGATVARVDALWLDREQLTLEGKAISVEWWDGEALWVHSEGGQGVAPPAIYRSARQLLSYDLARLLPARLGLAPGDAPLVQAAEGTRWFHWLGDLYGRAILDLLRYQIAARETDAPGLCIDLPEPLAVLPTWDERTVARYLRDNYRRYEPLLDLGPFHTLLPTHLRRRTVVEQFAVGSFLAAIAALRPLVAPEALCEDLSALTEETIHRRGAETQR